MRHLIMCCDGTWNTPGQDAVTNVRRLYNVLADTDRDGNRQLSHYQSGVGTESAGLLGWLLGGIAGVGLSRNVMDAYHWLTTTYEPGDHIALFGFSRGAYTARSLAGMITACGLIDTSGMDEAEVWDRIEHLYRRRYRPGDDARPSWRKGLRFNWDPDWAGDIPVRFLGVWDTVGSLGVPDTLGWLNLLDPARRYAFHDLRLNEHIKHARHAVALDEQRGPFSPTLWTYRPGQDVRTVWFPGSHLDVGGGHPETGLSDGALRWMLKEARDAVGLEFREQDQLKPDPLGLLHDDSRGIYGLLEPLYEPVLRSVLEPFFEPRPRATPMIGEPGPDSALHESVHERHAAPSITGGRYRPTRMLRPGDSHTVEVSAREPWNWTALYLEAGDYAFDPQGRWTDLGTESGPGGLGGRPTLRPAALVRLAGTVLGLGEPVFRRVTGNRVANFPLSRRHEDLPWMSLVGVVANDATVLGPDQALHERIAIGPGAKHSVRRPGYLYAYANDAWSFYGNNRGSVRLTVTRTA